MLSLGRADLNFKLGLIRKGLKSIGFVVVAIWGIIPFLYSMLAISFLNSLLNMQAVGRLINIRLTRQLRLLCYYPISVAISILIIDRLEFLFASELVIFSIIKIGVTFLIIYSLLNILMFSPAINIIRKELSI